MKNPTPRKGSTRMINKQTFHYIGRSFYESKAKDVAYDLKRAGMGIAIFKRSDGFFVYATKPVYVPMMEVGNEELYNPIVECPICHLTVPVTVSQSRSDVLLEHIRKARHNPEKATKLTCECEQLGCGHDNKPCFKQAVYKVSTPHGKYDLCVNCAINMWNYMESLKHRHAAAPYTFKGNPATSVAQQRLFGIALGIKEGRIPKSYSPEAARMAAGMSMRKLREFASTGLKGLPAHVNPPLHCECEHLSHKGKCPSEATRLTYTADQRAIKVCEYCADKHVHKKSIPLYGTLNPDMTKALAMRERYQDDLKAGHDAAEFWRGQASAYFTGNPKEYTHLVGSFYSKAEARTMIKRLKAQGYNACLQVKKQPLFNIYNVYMPDQPNPIGLAGVIPTIGTGIVTGLGLGAGFKVANAAWDRVFNKKVKNPSYNLHMTSITQKERHGVNKILYELGKLYHDGIPLGTIAAALRKYGLVIIQEDNTEWSGFLLGDSAQTDFTIARLSSEFNKQYEPIKNTRLAMSWYKMQSGRYEIVAYLT